MLGWEPRERAVDSTERWPLAFVRRLGFGYSCFRIYGLALSKETTASAEALPAGYRFAEVSLTDLARCPFRELQECDSYGGPGSHIFGIFRGDGVLASVQCVWFGERYRQQAFWPLAVDDAASMHLVTAEPERGKGLATHLKQHSAGWLLTNGFAYLYSRIWWTNTASLRVSEKAGWTQVGTVLEIDLPGLKTPVRRVFRRRGHDKASEGA